MNDQQLSTLITALTPSKPTIGKQFKNVLITLILYDLGNTVLASAKHIARDQDTRNKIKSKFKSFTGSIKRKLAA